VRKSEESNGMRGNPENQRGNDAVDGSAHTTRERQRCKRRRRYVKRYCDEVSDHYHDRS
jgi:hypothetical protein